MKKLSEIFSKSSKLSAFKDKTTPSTEVEESKMEMEKLFLKKEVMKPGRKRSGTRLSRPTLTTSLSILKEKFPGPTEQFFLKKVELMPSKNGLRTNTRHQPLTERPSTFTKTEQ